MKRPELRPAEVFYPESDGKPMAETDVHRDLMVDMIDALRLRLADEAETYVSGNLLVYYEEGNPRASVAPDVFLVRGVKKGPRRIYKVWEEGRGPDLVLEITSRSTHREDLGKKRAIYEELAVREYFLFDPEGVKFQPPLRGFRLTDGGYEPLPLARTTEGSLVLPSAFLGLELRAEGSALRWVDPRTGEVLPTAAEAQRARAEAEKARVDVEKGRAEDEKARADAEKVRAEVEKARAEAEKARADQAEAELARLRAELSRREERRDPSS